MKTYISIEIEAGRERERMNNWEERTKKNKTRKNKNSIWWTNICPYSAKLVNRRIIADKKKVWVIFFESLVPATKITSLNLPHILTHFVDDMRDSDEKIFWEMTHSSAIGALFYFFSSQFKNVNVVHWGQTGDEQKRKIATKSNIYGHLLFVQTNQLCIFIWHAMLHID